MLNSHLSSLLNLCLSCLQREDFVLKNVDSIASESLNDIVQFCSPTNYGTLYTVASQALGLMKAYLNS